MSLLSKSDFDDHKAKYTPSRSLRFITTDNDYNASQYISEYSRPNNSFCRDGELAQNLYDSKINNVKMIIVWDLDETIIYFDLEAKVKQEPYYYLKPNILQTLYFCAKLPNCLNILWSMGRDDYVHDALYKLNLTKYFSHVLTRTDCDKSKEKYSVWKSYLYVLDYLKIPHGTAIKSILIDDKAYENSKQKYFLEDSPESTYTHVLQPAPFTDKSILRFLDNKKDSGLVDLYNYLFAFYIKYNQPWIDKK